MELLLHSTAESYNDLLSIVDANRKLNELGGDETVASVLAVVKAAGMEELIGIRLLHKHNDVYKDEFMFESAVVDEEGFALVTTAAKAGRVGEIRANSWRTTADGYIPVEFSDPELLYSSNFEICQNRLLFNRISEALMDYHAERVLGPCMNYGVCVTSHSPSGDAAFLEKTDSENRANVVRYLLRSDLSFINSAKTKWYAKQVKDGNGKMTWTTSCKCFCSVFPSGGHIGTKTHQYSAPKDPE